jgi:hypothetical protein
VASAGRWFRPPRRPPTPDGKSTVDTINENRPGDAFGNERGCTRNSNWLLGARTNWLLGARTCALAAQGCTPCARNLHTGLSRAGLDWARKAGCSRSPGTLGAAT